jgi:hypothetical protein
MPVIAAPLLVLAGVMAPAAAAAAEGVCGVLLVRAAAELPPDTANTCETAADQHSNTFTQHVLLSSDQHA